ncbi:MAG TPA: sugar phosphate isomerase/epimerase [Bryobacterales bacterium]|jgi:inosose dehydratase|nr:sugar phosphate isomerase/epimerase [Bryobacterales bacterium]
MLSRRQFLRLCSATCATSAAGVAAAKPRFRIGITTNTRNGGSWDKDMLLSFREAAEAGYHNVETFYGYIRPWWDKPQELKSQMDRLKLGFVTISNGGPMKMQFENPSVAQQLIDEHVQLALWSKKWFGCDHLKANTGGRRPEGTTSDDLAQMARTMNEIGKRLADQGLKFGVHAHLWTQLQTRSEIDHIMDATDPRYVFLVLDTGHITMAGMDPVELARTYVSRIVEFHLKDTKPEDKGGHKGPTPQREGYTAIGKRIFFELGKGGVDFPGLLSVLKQNNWDGWLTVELDSTDTTPKDSAMISRRYLENVLHLQV